MRSKKQAVIFLAIIAIISFFIFTILYFKFVPNAIIVYIHIEFPEIQLRYIGNYLITISSGIFTGSILSLFIYIKEYKSSKIECLSNFWNEICLLNDNFFNLKVFKVREPIDILKNYYRELSDNKMIINLNEQSYNIYINDSSEENMKIYKKDFRPLKHKSKDALSEWIFAHIDDSTKSILNNNIDKEQYIKDYIYKMLEENDKQLEKILKQYVKFKSLKILELNKAFYSIDFLFVNKSMRANIYNNIFMVQTGVIFFIKEQSSEFENFINGVNTNKSVMIDYIQKIQNKIFRFEQKNDMTYVTSQFLYEINVELEKLLRYTYGKKVENNTIDIKEYIVEGYYFKTSD